MGYAIELFFDGESEGRLFSLWDEFAALGAPSMRQGDGRPHVSLCVAETVDVEAVGGMLEELGRTVGAFPLMLAALGFFPSKERVAFLSPKVTPELLALQARVFGEFEKVAQGLWPHYAPGSWVPHCTLSLGVATEQLGAAFEACLGFGLPLHGTVVEVGLVEFRPVRHLHTVVLGG